MATMQKGASTRSSIIGAARRVFRQTGVNGSGLHEVACAANVTRGAVYWHFDNKVDLFHAMLSESKVPLVNTIVAATEDQMATDPLDALGKALAAIFQQLRRDGSARDVLEIILLRCEVVGEFAGVHSTVLLGQQEHVRYFEHLYQLAKQKGFLRPELDPRMVAIDTYHFISSLVRGWLADPEVQSSGIPLDAIQTHIALRRAGG